MIRQSLPMLTDADLDIPLDPGIKRAVEVLRRAGIPTYESCEGGEGHSSPEPVVRFNASMAEGFYALSAALDACLPVRTLRRVWRMDDGEPTGPWWELTFLPEAGRQ